VGSSGETKVKNGLIVESVEDGRVLALTLDQPKGNVLTLQLMTEIQSALTAHRDDQHLKMVLLRGAGKDFSFGASVAEHRPKIAPFLLHTFHDLVREVAVYPVPVTALVQGRCLGGAFELLLACHFVFATETAVFGVPEVKLGVLPPVMAVLGHHRLGTALTERLTLTGAEVGPSRLLQSGFLCDVFASTDAADDRLFAWYRTWLAPLSAFALREATSAARLGSGLLASLGKPLDLAEQRYVDRLLTSHDGIEGIEAFLAKRAPQWVDK
jgi:cyclohexa-1,5-dienecarbonyl-CoA hydratase